MRAEHIQELCDRERERKAADCLENVSHAIQPFTRAKQSLLWSMDLYYYCIFPFWSSEVKN